MEFFAGVRLALALSVLLWGAIGGATYAVLGSEPPRIMLSLR